LVIVSHKLFIRAETALRVSNFHIHEDEGESLTAAITEQPFYVKYNSAAMWISSVTSCEKMPFPSLWLASGDISISSHMR